MRQSKTLFRRRAETGSIAVETVLCLPLLILFLVVPLFLARAFWYYSVAQKAAHDGARFLSNTTQSEIAPGAVVGDAPIALLARSIVDAEMDDIKPGLEGYTITALCDGDGCGLTVPQTVRVSVRLTMRDNVFSAFTTEMFGEDPLLLEARVTMRYVGN